MDDKFITISRLEFIVKQILPKDEAIYIMFCTKNIGKLDHYYFICNKKEEIVIRHVTLNSDYEFTIGNVIPKNSIEIVNLISKVRIKSLLSYSFNYDINKDGNIVYDEDDKPMFYCFLPGIDRFYSFGSKSEKIIYNGFYDFLNYLFVCSEVNNDTFKRNSDDKSIFDSFMVLDDEINKYLIDNKPSRNTPLEKRITKMLKETNYKEKCDDLTSMMDNYNLIASICFTDYIPKIGNSFEKLKPEKYNWDVIRNNHEERLKAFYAIVNNKDFILTRDTTIDNKNEIIKRLEIDHQIDLVLKCMSNEEIMELTKETKNWNVKLDLMKYIDSSKEK